MKTVTEKIYNNHILTYGFPKQINHGFGKEFNNTLLRKLNQFCGIKSTKTTLCHPSGDG